MNESDKMKIDIIKNKNRLLRCENRGLKMQVIELENKIAELQVQTCRKHNERKAGRKEYQNIDVIRSIYRMYAQGKNYQEIADKLNSESYAKNGVLSEKEYNLDFS